MTTLPVHLALEPEFDEPEVPAVPIRDAALGLLLHRFRLKALLTCAQAAERSGLPASRIEGVEAGDGDLPFTDAMPLLAAYGTDLAQFSEQLLDLIDHQRKRLPGEIR